MTPVLAFSSDPEIFIRPRPLKVAVLVDLVRRPHAGGHIKCWERFAEAAESFPQDINLTIFFSADRPFSERRGNVTMIGFRPVFSTSRIPFIGHMPDHADLSPYHPALARALTEGKFDVIHSTDGFFAYAKTAERVCRKLGIPLTTSVHTDTPHYSEIFTEKTIRHVLGNSRLARWLIEKRRLPFKQGNRMRERLLTHLRACAHILASNDADLALASSVKNGRGVGWLRLGCNLETFRPDGKAAQEIRTAYGIDPDALALLFVGRLDEGKNIYTLGEAILRVRGQGVPLHLLAAGEGPAALWLKEKLGDRFTHLGVMPPEKLARCYAGADLLALPSEVETWSLAAIESLACGTPVIASAGSGVGRFIEDPETRRMAGAIVADSRNPESWAEMLAAAAQTPNRLSQWRDAVPVAAKPWIATWAEALQSDLLPIWRNAARRAAYVRP